MRFSSSTSDVVDAAELLSRPAANRLFIDVRLGDPADELKSYRDGHIHGAVHGQIRDVFAAQPTKDSGNLPLPDVRDLERQLHAWGVDQDTEIVLYGPSLALAARGWWVLRWAGLKNVKVLDGGLKSWISQGGAVAQGDATPRPTGTSVLHLTPGHLPSLSADEVESVAASVLLIDARDENSFLAGAIPHAVNLPSAEQWTPGSSLRTVDEVRALYERVGALSGKKVVAYCGGGVLSALVVLTLSALGVQPALYVGSWSEWNKSARRMALSAREGVSA